MVKPIRTQSDVNYKCSLMAISSDPDATASSLGSKRNQGDRNVRRDRVVKWVTVDARLWLRLAGELERSSVHSIK